MSDKPQCFVVLQVLTHLAGKFNEEIVFSYYSSRLSMSVIITNPAMPYTVVLAKNRNYDYIKASGNEFNRAQILAVR